MTAGIPGAIVECGVGRGRSLVVLSALNHMLDAAEGGQREIVGFDSFAGFPKPEPQDTSFRNPKKGEWSHSSSGKYEYSMEFIYRVLAKARLGEAVKRVNLEKGFFSDTLPQSSGGPIAILHLDGYLYISYRDPLNNLYDKVVPGGVIVFDDFTTEKAGEDRFPGARKATEEFLADKPEQLRDTPYLVKQ